MDYCIQIYAASVDLSILYLWCHRSTFIHFPFIYLKIVFILTSNASTGEKSHMAFNQGLSFCQSTCLPLNGMKRVRAFCTHFLKNTY